MTESKTTQSSPSSDRGEKTLALLERIAVGTEANGTFMHELAEQIAELRQDLEGQAAARAVAAPAGPHIISAQSYVGANCVDFQAESIVVTTDEEGKPAYRVRGFPFVKFGVRAWTEVLPALGVDPAALKPGPNPFSALVRAVLNEEGKPRKVIGPAA